MANKKVTARGGKRGKKAKESSLPLQPSLHLQALSMEVLYLIASFLDPLGVNKLALVCRAFIAYYAGQSPSSSCASS